MIEKQGLLSMGWSSKAPPQGDNIGATIKMKRRNELLVDQKAGTSARIKAQELTEVWPVWQKSQKSRVAGEE